MDNTLIIEKGDFFFSCPRRPKSHTPRLPEFDAQFTHRIIPTATHETNRSLHP